MKGDIYVSTSEAARLLNVCSRTVINYCERNKLVHRKNDITKRYSISLAGLRRFIKNNCDHQENVNA